jgi:ribonuclease E
MRVDDVGETPAGYREGEEQPYVQDGMPRAEAGYNGNVHEVAEDQDDDATGAEARGGDDHPDRHDGENGDRRGRRRRRGRRGGRRGHERDQASPAGERGGTDGWERPERAEGDDQPQPYMHAKQSADWQPAYVEPAHGSSPEPVPVETRGWDDGNAHLASGAPVSSRVEPPAEPDQTALSAEPVMTSPVAPVDERPPPIPAPAPELVAATPAPSPRSQPVASEPVLERVVVGPNAAPPEEGDTPRPARRGWWQRR